MNIPININRTLLLFILSIGPIVHTQTINISELPTHNKLNLGISFPPVADESQRNFTEPILKELNVNKIRIAENWKFREPKEGIYHWKPLDERIKWAEKNNIDLLLTIQSIGPKWACSEQKNNNSCVFKNNNKFKTYIEKLLKRYPNKIRKLQFGNEWQTEFWFIGSAKEYVELNNIVYNAIKKYSPKTQLVLGGYAIDALKYLSACKGEIYEFYDNEGRYFDKPSIEKQCQSTKIQHYLERSDYVLKNTKYDEVDIHLYDDAENWAIYVNSFKSDIQKPIIVSEFGGPNLYIEPDSEVYQSNRLKTYIRTLEQLDIKEAYYFKLVEGSDNPAHARSGLITYPDLSKKQSYFTFKTYNNP